MVNAKGKGSAGEREFAEWLFNVLSLKEKPQRNLEQTRKRGADIVDVPPFIFEVKRCEKLSIRDWWIKLVNTTPEGKIPIIAYRQNFKTWKFIISAKIIDLKIGYIQLEEPEFKEWLRNFYSEYLFDQTYNLDTFAK